MGRVSQDSTAQHRTVSTFLYTVWERYGGPVTPQSRGAERAAQRTVRGGSRGRHSSTLTLLALDGGTGGQDRTGHLRAGMDTVTASSTVYIFISTSTIKRSTQYRIASYGTARHREGGGGVMTPFRCIPCNQERKGYRAFLPLPLPPLIDWAPYGLYTSIGCQLIFKQLCSVQSRRND